MVFGIGKKRDEEMQLSSPPINHVMSMRQQGLNNNQIIQNLQRMGYPPNLIFDAMNQADIKGSVQPIPADFLQQPQQPQGSQLPSQQPSMPSMDFSQPQQSGEPVSKESVEEMVETIIDEKWEELMKNVNKIIDWKNKADAKVGQLEQQFKDLKQDFDKLHNAVLGKVAEYDQNIINVGTEIKAMEKVFQQIIPTFTENVNELSRLTQNIKKDSLQKKK